MANPLETALKEISATRNLLELLIISSERFHYQRAKLVLIELERKVKDLARLQAELEAVREEQPNVLAFELLRAESVSKPR